MVVQERYEYDQEKSFKLLTRTLRSWGGKTLFKLASTAGRADFVNNYCFQSQLDNIWYGRVAVSVPQWKVNCNIYSPLFFVFTVFGVDTV